MTAHPPPLPTPQREWGLDLPMHDYLDFRLHGDGHTYQASLRLNAFNDDEIWQAALPTRYGQGGVAYQVWQAALPTRYDQGGVADQV